MRVGRSALDEDAIRLLEQYNPDVEFDWTRILKGQPEPMPEATPAVKVEPVRRDRGPHRPEPPAPVETRRKQEPRDVAPPPVPMEPPEFDADENLVPDPEGTPTAAQARLGSEGLLRLRARYAEVLARITERIADSVQQEELKSKAERLNPDAWVTDEEVRVGLDGYESTFEELRALVGRPRKRRRRRRGDDPRSPRVQDDAAQGMNGTEAPRAEAAGEPSAAPPGADEIDGEDT